MDKLYSDEVTKLMPACEEFIKTRVLKALIIYGKKGSGKKELVDQLLDRIFSDQSLLIHVPKLNRKGIFQMEYGKADQMTEHPYAAFIEIARLMERKRRTLAVFNRLFGVLLAAVGISDFVDKFKDLAEEIRNFKDQEDKFREKELKLFNRFAQELRRYCRKKPFIVMIRNAQWMDRNSRQLLKHLLEDTSSFWGLFVLEYSTDDPPQAQSGDNIFWDLIKENKITSVQAKLLNLQYLQKYQKEKFGTILFSDDESERIITLALEMPSKLDELIESWKYQKLIFMDNGSWVKSRTLQMKELKTPEEKLIEVFKVFAVDGVISGKEEEAFRTQAQSLGCSDEQIDKMRMIASFETVNPRYHIIQKIRPGTIGDIYKAFDVERNRNVFVEIDQRLTTALPEDEWGSSLMSSSLLNTVEQSHAEKLNFIVTEYTRGSALADIRSEYMFFDFDRTNTIARGLLSAIAILHRRSFIHGNIHPDNIFIEVDGSVKVGGIGFIKKMKHDVGKGLLFLPTSPYSSPEHIKQEGLTLQSDVFSLGVVIYELFTGQLPFSGDSEKQIMEAILSSPIKESAYLDHLRDLKAILYKALDKNDQGRPSSAESLSISFDHILPPLPANAHKNHASVGRKIRSRSLSVFWKWAAGLVVLGAAFFGGKTLVQTVFPPEVDPNLIMINRFNYDNQNFPRNFIENSLQRSIMASTEKLVSLSGANDRKESSRVVPENIISGEVITDQRGYSIVITINNRGKKSSKEFHCRGPLNLLNENINEIQTFLSEKSNGTIKNLEKGKSYAALFTDNWEACSNYYLGRDAWRIIDTNTAARHFRNAINIDPKFSLARMRLAEVLIWQSNYAEAREQIVSAKQNPDRLTFTEKIRLDSLEARVNGDKVKERNFLAQLTELLPTKKYFYDYGESFFNYGEAKEAIKQYERALVIDPKYAVALNHIGLCFSWLGDHSSAEKRLKAYVEIDKTPNSYDSLASGYMFAGKYAQAIKICLQGLAIQSDEALYGNLASNLLLSGQLEKAAENWKKQISITTLDSTKADASFYLGLVDYLRGRPDSTRQILTAAKKFYSQASYSNDVTDSACFPFWLEGVMAYESKNINGLNENIDILDNKVTRNNVSEDNYSPVLKFDLHLQALAASLKNDRAKLLAAVESGERIKDKMGYWTSIFNLSYMFNEYATLLIGTGDVERAQKLVDQAISYNPNESRSYLNRARIALHSGKLAEAKAAIQKAGLLLAGADRDFELVRQLQEMMKKGI